MNKGYLTLLGFICFALGFLSIIFMIIGLQFSMLAWLQSFGTVGAIVGKLILLFGGLIIMYISKMDTSQD